MKKASKQHLVLQRDTLKALTELPNTAYGHVVGGGYPTQGIACGSDANVNGDHPIKQQAK